MLRASKYFPKAERRILEYLNDQEKTCFFIRDLHFANKDYDLNDVIKVINKTVNEIAGKKAANTIADVKKKFLG